MNILFCRVGWASKYDGDINDKPKNGGSYNINDIGHELYNFKEYNGYYYGYVRSRNNTINVETINPECKKAYLDDVLVVWIAKSPAGGEVIVGWYNHATVYKKLQELSPTIMQNRELKNYNTYHIVSNDVYLVPVNERNYKIEGAGQSNVWFCNRTEDDIQIKENVQKYIFDHEALVSQNEKISKIEKSLNNLKGLEREAVIKVRVNQSVYRNKILALHKKCCLCGISDERLLIASHLKPWVESDENEKLDKHNGLLLCPNHDKLVDRGFISFADDGSILVSSALSDNDKKLLNIAENIKIKVTDENAKYIKYHRENIFIK